MQLNKLKLTQISVFEGMGKSKGLRKTLWDQSKGPHMGVEPWPH